MKCPNCNETLLMTERQSVEIDYCPSCRGIWLDKGELDKLLEIASQNATPSSPAQAAPRQDTFNPNYNDGRYYDNRYHEKHKYHGRKKKSFLSDFFDFD